MAGNRVVAELELGWPNKKCGIAITKADTEAAMKVGWEVWSVGRFLENYANFPVWKQENTYMH